MTEQQLIKDGLGEEAVSRIAASLARVIQDFPEDRFRKKAMDGIGELELKDRVRHLVRVLNDFLPQDFAETAGILVRLKDNWIEGDPDDRLRGLAAWPVIDYVGEYGLSYPDHALAALRELTPFFSAEFAIRPFIIEHPDTAFRYLHEWTADGDERVRRLVSEGSRPRLPWGQQLPEIIADPSATLELLEKLKDDPSEYVRRSVANHLNDISKDHPDTVVGVCRRWQDGASPERLWIIRHATRTLVKAGHPAVFGLLGYTDDPLLDLESLELVSADIAMGDTLEFAVGLKSSADKHQKVVVDYAIHHVKANGKTSPKVFKFSKLEIGPGETARLVKRHSIRPITTRKYYPGEHSVEILVNGKSMGSKSFTLAID
jgi:3-methyladenine DNA glycosylase AlkC